VRNSSGTVAEYFYDSNGQRFKKNESGTVTYYVGNHYETVVYSDGSSVNTSYYFANGERAAKRVVNSSNPSGSVYYYHPDHLGSTNVISNSSGGLVETTKYFPFGEIRAGGTENKYLFNSKEYEADIGVYYYGARYYAPEVRRWTQPDPIIQDYYNPQNLNRYSYTLNNPVKYVDPSGNEAVRSEAGLAEKVSETFDKIINYVKQTNPDATPSDVYTIAYSYYHSGQYRRDNVPRYIYTEEMGWIDLKHYFRTAQEACNKGGMNIFGFETSGVVDTSEAEANIKAFFVEVAQSGFEYGSGVAISIGPLKSGSHWGSAFSFEDVPSNAAGASLGSKTKDLSVDELKSQFDKHMQELGATYPGADPNFAKLRYNEVIRYEERAYKIPWILPIKAPDWWM